MQHCLGSPQGMTVRSLQCALQLGAMRPRHTSPLPT